MKFNNLDEAQGVFFSRELEYVKEKTYDVKRPNYGYARAFPINTQSGAGAQTITYQQYDSTGVMKIISAYANDLPRSDIKGKEFTVKVKTLAGSYGYNYDEVLASQQASLFSGTGPKKTAGFLDMKRAESARRSYDQTVNEIAWFANPTDPKWEGLCGLLYFPNIPVMTASTKVAGGTGWQTATADEIVDDLNRLYNSVTDITNGVEQVNTIMVPPLQLGYAQTKRLPNTETTALKFFLDTHAGVAVEAFAELKNVSPLPSTGVGSGNIAIAYNRSPEALELNIPSPFKQLPVQEQGLEYLIPTHARIASMNVYYPLSIAFMEGI